MADVQEAGSAVVSPGDMSKEDKEAMLNRKMEEIRRKNEALLKRHQEVEADRRTAEKTGSSIPVKGGAAVVVSPTTKSADFQFPEANERRKPPPRGTHDDQDGHDRTDRRGPPRGRGRGRGGPRGDFPPKSPGSQRIPKEQRDTREQWKSKEQREPRGSRESPRAPKDSFPPKSPGQPRGPGTGRGRGRDRREGGGGGGREDTKAKEWEEKRKKNIEQMEEELRLMSELELEGKRLRHFLDDPRRQGPLPEAVEDRHQGSRRSAMNWGGKDFDGVKHGMEQLKKQQKQGRYHQRGSRDKMDMTLSMTGRERKEYEEWRQERERIDRERLERHRTAGGEWKREWDQEKLDGNVEPADVLAPSQPTLGAWIETSGRQRGGKRIGSGRFPAADSNQPRRPERDRKGDRHEEGEGRRKQRRRTRSLKGDKAEKAAAEGLTVTVQGENRKVENKENNREQAEVADAQETANTPMEEAVAEDNGHANNNNNNNRFRPISPLVMPPAREPPSPTNPMSPTSPLELRTPPDHVHVADWAVEMGESGSGSLSGDWGDVQQGQGYPPDARMDSPYGEEEEGQEFHDCEDDIVEKTSEEPKPQRTECRRRHRTGSDSAPGQGVSGEDITTEVPSKDEHDVLTPVQDSSAGQTKASDSSEVSSPSESVSTSEEVTPTNQEAPAIPSEELVKQDTAVKAEESPVTAAEPSTVNAEDVKETAVPVAETTVEAAKSSEAVAEPAEPTSEDMTVLRTETQDAEKSPTESTGEQAEDSAPAEGEERDHSEDVREGESPPPTLEPSLSDCEFPLSDAESSCGAINISDYNTVAYTKKTSP
ncbi:PREDICTED: coiled-coil domain-containing protein 9-like isoform X2 [Branchiostoma belcheri]|uniref:Coiled-coil domain-containing protein 9-like isoform X2 n=1 Tax=Branchiostoma belcheri TaxID=7741 RepID=A0A6P4YT32_BRABE|nr:PREDICTED: coiled-coil domain-containing protein 9-like isoform X2 [Branchiostoma belcheri]